MADHFSVYGYDTRMLPCDDGLSSNQTAMQPRIEVPKLKEDSVGCPLLGLPPELRQEILSYVLPQTIETAIGPVWLRGHTAILTVNKLLHFEGIRLMYGNSTFIVKVTWMTITFTYKWLSPTGLVPTRTLAFPWQLPSRNLPKIRKLMVRVHHDDDYIGTVKHNFSGPGLVEGMKTQIQRLCETLQDLEQIRDLLIHFKNDNRDTGVDQVILSPLLALKNTQTVRTAGAVTSTFRQILKDRLNGACDRNSFLRLPLELRERVYDLLLPSTETVINTDQTQRNYIQRRWRHGHLAIMRTSSAIYVEASRFWYGTRNFQLTCEDDHFAFTPYWLPKSPLLPGFPFPQSIGNHNLFLIKHFTIYIPLWWMSTDDEGRNKRSSMLKGLGKLLGNARTISSLTLVCLCSNLSKEWYEEAMQEISRIRDVGNVIIYGLDQDMAERFRSQLEAHAKKAR
ncbi:MAG: hypothetical protein Q9191_006484 [Dirinaria sp. TL-2023a]